MVQTTQVNRPDPQAYLGYHRDGVGDLMIGAGLLIFSLAIFLDQVWMGGVVAAILAPLWQPLKQSITAPRLRESERAESDRARNSRQAFVLLGVLVLLLGIAFFALVATDALPASMQDGLRTYFELVLGLVGAGVCVVGGLFTGINRLYVYAPVVAAIFAMGQWLATGPGVSFALAGALFLAGGSLLLIRFLRAHPRRA